MIMNKSQLRMQLRTKDYPVPKAAAVANKREDVILARVAPSHAQKKNHQTTITVRNRTSAINNIYALQLQLARTPICR